MSQSFKVAQLFKHCFNFHWIEFYWKDDPKVHAVVDKLLDVLNTPSEVVQWGSILLSISFDAIKASMQEHFY
ncbi:hypothetical protein RIF29_39080 [Crotalaria pallida]|uniref:Uncharacterized protein n=1 Tax=Crotalaria pallida TaxID=3830 RepID=A0AAN9HPH3_CROPI